jgi:hypothetical protein
MPAIWEKARLAETLALLDSCSDRGPAEACE